MTHEEFTLGIKEDLKDMYYAYHTGDKDQVIRIANFLIKVYEEDENYEECAEIKKLLKKVESLTLDNCAIKYYSGWDRVIYKNGKQIKI